MGGIIQGFLGGAANAMGEAGKMAFANQLTKERDEANFLRDSELAKTLKREDITSREKISANDLAGRERIAESRDKTLLEAANVRAAATRSGASKPTSQMKNVNDLIGRGWSEESAVGHVYPGATIQHDSPDGERVVVLRGKEVGQEQEIGRFMPNDRGVSEFVGFGNQPTQTKMTKDQREKLRDLWNTEGHEKNKSLWFSWDTNDKELKKFGDDLVKSGQFDQYISGGSNSSAEGLVNQQTQGKTKKVGASGREMTKQQFIDAMVDHHGEGKMDEILETWESIK